MSAVREFKRIIAVLIAAFVSFKITIVVFANSIPGQPFYDFAVMDWLWWLLDTHEALFVGTAALLEYALTRALAWRISPSSVVILIWASALGNYIAVAVYPFDILGRVSALSESFWSSGAVGAAVEVGMLVGAPVLVFLFLVWASQHIKARSWL